MVTALPPPPVPAQIYDEQADYRWRFDEILDQLPAKHFLSKEHLRNLLSRYSGEELRRIYHDFFDIKEKTLSNPVYEKNYLVTAGGPGSGKTTLLEELVSQREVKPAYIDPDRTCLLNMKTTYVRDLQLRVRNEQEAYEHWRDASNFIANTLLAVALKEGVSIAHGSTMTSPAAAKVLDHIRSEYGYRVEMIEVNKSN